MACEVRDIPPAERHVRWTAVLSYRWPMALTGLLMTVYGGLIALMLFHARGGKPRDDALLDDGPTLFAQATIQKAKPSSATWIAGGRADHVSYRFATDRGMPVEGSSFGPAEKFRPGETHPVEYLPEQPETNRLQDTRLCLLGDLVSPVLGLVVLPGVLVLLLWLQGAWELRRLLQRGDVAAAEPVRVRKVAWVVPVMLAAHYRFRDHHARWCEGRHWVRARSALGARLLEAPGRVAVVHDRAHPERSRLAVAPDFCPGPRTPREPQAARRA